MVMGMLHPVMLTQSKEEESGRFIVLHPVYIGDPGKPVSLGWTVAVSFCGSSSVLLHLFKIIGPIWKKFFFLIFTVIFAYKAINI